MTRGSMLSVVALVAASAGGVYVVQATTPSVFPPPIVSSSTVTVPDRNQVAVATQWTPRCALVNRINVCPDSFDVRYVVQTASGYSDPRRGRTSILRDTVIVDRPICPDSLRVVVYVAARSRGAIERSNIGSSRPLSIRCRAITRDEQLADAALRDTFPDDGLVITTASEWWHKQSKDERDVALLETLRQARTARDSTTAIAEWRALDKLPDSIRVVPKGDTVAIVGYSNDMCLLARNRYTGRVEILSGDPTRCETARVKFDAKRSS